MADNDSRAGHRYATPAIMDWCIGIHAAHDAALTQAFATPADVPAIMVGPSEGTLLGLLCRLVGARRVVEVGTLVGYSALHIARTLPSDGHLWTVEFDRKHADLARANLTAGGVASKVTVVDGAGVDMLPSLSQHGPFDAVFIDADKVNYHHYGRWAVDNLRSGGIVIGDNAYLFGELLEDSDRGHAMRGFHQLVAAHCDSVCIPTPDGLVLGIKR
jgi:caffeoyl-CoA O-methyltransferase